MICFGDTRAIILYKEFIMSRMFVIIDLYLSILLVVIFDGITDEIGEYLKQKNLFRIHYG